MFIILLDFLSRFNYFGVPNYKGLTLIKPLTILFMFSGWLWLSCGHENSPKGVAEEFLFRYLIELNQQGALELSTGLAADNLRKEIQAVQSVRRDPDLDMSSHKPFIDYKLVNTQERSDHSFTLFYDISIESRGGSNSTRQLVLSTIKIDGVWKVNNYETFTR